MKRLRPWLWAGLSGALTFLGFAGFGLWPLAFVAFTPLFFAIDDLQERREGKGVFRVSLFYGFVTSWGGYYWLVPTLETFSGFPPIVCVLIASVLLLYTSALFAVFGWLYARLLRRGVAPAWASAIALVVCEWLYPLLFPFHYGASFHNVPWLVQIADLGGVLLVSALSAMTSGAVFEVLRARRRLGMRPRFGPRSALVFLVLTLVYGAFSLARDFGETTPLRVGIVQANMDVFAKRFSVEEGDRRHVEQSAELERTERPDLIVWPESAYVHFLEGATDDVSASAYGGVLRTPHLFGTLQVHFDEGGMRYTNTAMLADARGRVLGTYDKTFLLAFSEYMPFSDVFPALQRWSPNSGRFSQGTHVRPLSLEQGGRTLRLGTIICYEDILPSFVRRLVEEARPHALVNITNDAWFGDTHEPWIHLALAKLRAVEHRLPLIRATNSGVSAFVDAWGRETTRTETFVRANLVETVDVPVEPPRTLFAILGAWPGWLALFATIAFGFLRRPRI